MGHGKYTLYPLLIYSGSHPDELQFYLRASAVFYLFDVQYSIENYYHWPLLSGFN